MRSTRRSDPGQMSLWDEPEADHPARAGVPKGRRGALLAHELVGYEFPSRGWGAGTVCYYEAVRRIERGDVVVVRRGERIVVGEVGIQWGRQVARSDRGALWLGPDCEVLGVVRMVEPPLPELSALAPAAG